MRKKLRKSGINVVGDIPWGTHICQFYQTKEDLIDILVSYFKTGLENNEYCMWITSVPLRTEEAEKSLRKAIKNLDKYIKKGQIEILDYSDWYTKIGRFDADKVLKGWVKKEEWAIKNGFDGLRLTGNTFWLEKKDWKKFNEYEETVDSVIGEYKMIAICSYCLEKCSASDVIDVVYNHGFSLIKKDGKWNIIKSSEHKKAGEILHYERNLFQTLLDNIPDAIYFKDKNAKFVRVSKSMAEFFSTTVENLMGKTDFDFFEKDIAEQSFKDDLNIIESGVSIINKEEIDVALSGKKRWVLSTKLPWYDKDGNIIGMFGISRDITKRKETEMKLQESEERFRLIFENAGDGIIIANPKTKKFISANNKMCELTGYSLSEILCLGVEDIHPKEDLPKVIEEFEKQVRGEKLIASNLPILKKDGTIFYADISGKFITLDGVNCSVGVFRDITERKKLEEEKSSMDKLETINNMIVSINHEMNQPLSVITSYSNYLMEDAKKESQIYKDAKLINDEAWKLADLIKKISKLKKVKFTEYFPGTDMLDLNNIDNEEVNNE